MVVVLELIMKSYQRVVGVENVALSRRFSLDLTWLAMLYSFKQYNSRVVFEESAGNAQNNVEFIAVATVARQQPTERLKPPSFSFSHDLRCIKPIGLVQRRQ